MSKIFLGPAGIGIDCKGRSTPEGIRCAHDVGLNAFEVEFVRGVKMSAELAKQCGAVARELDMKLSVHAPYYINLASAEKEKITASMKRILDSVERGHWMGAEVVVFHPGYYGKRAKDEVFEMTKSACEEIIEKMKARGWTDVKLGLETTGKHSAFGTLDELVKLCKKIGTKYAVPVIDFAHMYARGGGKIDYAQVLDTIKPLKLKHLHSHFSNINYSDAGELNHLVLNGAPAFKPLAKEILKRKLDITIISESPILERDSLKMKGVFEKLGHRF